MVDKRLKPWTDRAMEVRSLFNPAFCGRVIYVTVTEYQKKTETGFPFALTYLILPLVLTSPIRNKISSRTQLTNWVQRNPELLINFGKRAANFVEITNEAIEFILQTGYLVLTDNGELSVSENKKKLSKKTDDQEIKECFTKAENVARWFANTDKVETVFVCLGVRP